MKNKHNKCYFPKKIIALIIGGLSLSLSAQIAVAQIGSSSLHGLVALHEQPQAGLEVIAKNIDNGYTFRALTQKDGTYIFNGLRPGNYQIYLQEKTGKNPDPIQLRVGQSLNLDFQLDKNTGANDVEEVVVVGSQLKSSSNGGEIGTTVSLEQINSLPQNTRNFLAFADLAPGVQFTQAADGSTKIKGGAQSANAINVFIDGVGQKNYVLQGGVTGQDSSRGNPFPQSAIGEYKIITQNYSAEYDQISSAAIVAVTKSGTNEFHGGVFGDFTNEGMRKLRPAEFSDSKKVPSSQRQFGFNVGGPIIQDKMHFFFSYEGKDNEDPKDIIPGAGYTKETLPAQYQSEVGSHAANFQEDLYFGKLDYLISDEQKVELTTKIRKEVELAGIGNTNTLSYGTDKKNDETRFNLSHNWRTDNWINDAHLTYEDSHFNPRAHTRGNGILLLKGDNGILNTGGGGDFQDKGQTGWGIQEDFSYLPLSNNTIKLGFKYKSIRLNAAEQIPYNPQYEYDTVYDWNQPRKVTWGAPLAGIGDGTITSDDKQFGVYLQDDWNATDKLLINAGLRWDYETSDSFLNYKTPTDVLASIDQWEGIKHSNININDYISNGHNREAFKNAWQPRIGFTYKLSDENDLALFGGVGRAYDRNLFDNLQLESTKATFPTYEAYFLTPNSSYCDDKVCNTWDPKYLTRNGLAQLQSGDKASGREVFMINNNLKTPYADQFSLGVRGGLNEYWNGEVSLSHIVSKDGFVWQLANRYSDGTFFRPGETWGAPWGQGIPGFGATIVGKNGIETKSNSFYFKLDKPKGDTDWGLTLAYTYMKATSNRESGDVFALDYPTLAGYGVHDITKSPNHRLVITTIAALPLGIDFSAKLNLQTESIYSGTDCRAGWNNCTTRFYKPDVSGFFGYRELDIAFSKNISTAMLTEGSILTIRLDILNLANTINHDGYDTWYGGADDINLPENFGKPDVSIAGPMRTMKLGVNWNW